MARLLKEQKPEPHWDANKRTQWELDVQAMATFCKTMNPAFDREKFLAACGWDYTEGK
jgi:hypothetical protein